MSSVAFALSALTVLLFVTHFLSFGNEYFLSALCFSLCLASMLTTTHPELFATVGCSDFYAAAVAAGEEGGMYLPVLLGRMCVWCGYVFYFHFNMSLSYINKQSQRMGCTVCSTKSVKYPG